MGIRRLRNHRGVTLVELMVLVAIIAIIAAIAITLYQDIQKKARLAADNGTIAALRSASAIYYGKNDGTFPTQATLQTLVLRAPVPGRDVGGRRHQRHHLHLEQHLGLLARP